MRCCGEGALQQAAAASHVFFVGPPTQEGSVSCVSRDPPTQEEWSLRACWILWESEEVPELPCAFEVKGLLPVIRSSGTVQILPLVHAFGLWSCSGGPLGSAICVSDHQFCYVNGQDSPSPWQDKVLLVQEVLEVLGASSSHGMWAPDGGQSLFRALLGY